MISSLRWERRRLAALRVVLSASADAGGLHLTPTLEALVNRAARFGATFDDLHPAGFTALYGLDRGKDALDRAALTAHAIHTALGRAPDAGLTARVAVHTAECLVVRGAAIPGMDADDRRRVSDVLDALLIPASAGSTIVSRDGARSLRRIFTLEPLGPGLGDLRAYRLGRHVHGPPGARRRLDANARLDGDVSRGQDGGHV